MRVTLRKGALGWQSSLVLTVGMGIVYLEASAAGLPVLAGDSGGAPDAVLAGETGWVVPDGVGASAELVERLEALLGDPPVRARLGARGREWVQADWSWGRQVERLEALVTGPPNR